MSAWLHWGAQKGRETAPDLDLSAVLFDDKARIVQVRLSLSHTHTHTLLDDKTSIEPIRSLDKHTHAPTTLIALAHHQILQQAHTHTHRRCFTGHWWPIKLADRSTPTHTHTHTHRRCFTEHWRPRPLSESESESECILNSLPLLLSTGGVLPNTGGRSRGRDPPRRRFDQRPSPSGAMASSRRPGPRPRPGTRRRNDRVGPA